MNESSFSKPSRTGAHRVVHFGNGLLSLSVFLVTVVLALVALDPSTSHLLLSARHRTPAINDSGAEFMAGFTPLVVEVKGNAMLVVPALTTPSSISGVARKLDYFLARRLHVAVNASFVLSDGTHTSPTLSDVFVALLQGGSSAAREATMPSTGSVRRQSNVLHLCSATSCTSPFVLQQWSNRGTAADAMHAGRANNASRDASARAWRRVQNFAIVFGAVGNAEAVMRELKQQRVMVERKASSSSADLVMPLIGSVHNESVVVSCCAATGWCRYSSVRKDTQISKFLQSEADALSNPAAKARVFAEWNGVRLDRVSTTLSTVRQQALSAATFGGNYTLQTVPFDVVYVDVKGEDSIAAFAYLHALASTTGVDGVAEHTLPRNILVCLYTSEWLDEVMGAVEDVEARRLYTVIPLVDGQQHAKNLAEEGVTGVGDFATWRASQQRWLRSSAYTAPLLSHSRTAYEPLAVLLLSRQFTSSELLRRVLNATAGPAASSPKDNFFFHALGVTAEDEAELNSFFGDLDDAEDATAEGSGVLHSFARFVVQYAYFLIPLTVAGVLVWSLCRPRRSR